MLHALIMAGGTGTRFWPASRSAKPKQLLDLAGSKSMIQATVARLGDLVAADRLMVLTNAKLVAPIREQLPELPPASVVGEPCKRDTAPCVGLAAALMAQSDPDATMVVMPSDHVIEPDSVFREAVQRAATLVDKCPKRLVTFGIRPTYPAESFGYIQRGKALTDDPSQTDEPSSFSVAKFREKPSKDVAEQYLADGGFYWNSGIFVWKAKTILDALGKYEPEMASHLDRIAAAATTADFEAVLQSEFEAIKGTSIDYAVMERYSDVAVIEAPFGWDDVGNWQSLARLRGVDEQGNTIVGKHLGERTEDCIIRSDDEHLVATLGVKNLIVVHTPDATLVAHRDDEESIRKLVSLLQERGWHDYL